MRTLYKYGFYTLIITCFTFYNFWTVSENQLNEKLKNEKEKNLKRILALLNSNLVLNRRIHEVEGFKLREQEKLLIMNKDSNYIVILLSHFDCAKCQEKELLKLQKLKTIFKRHSIKAICITTRSKIAEVSVQSKVIKLNLPIYYVNNDVFSYLSAVNKYPQVLLIKKGMLITVFEPVSKDFELSEMFYNQLLKTL